MAATMYPSELLEFDERSKEDLIYKALRDGLEPEYHVFHSQQIRHVDDCVILREKEIDFLVYHKEKGILCLEAKHCDPRYKAEFGYVNGRWQYSNNVIMKFGQRNPSSENSGGGPFMQAKYGQLAIMNDILIPALENKCRRENPGWGNRDIKNYCEEFIARFKIAYGVCFHGLTRAEIVAKQFPPEASKDLVLSLDDFKVGETKKAIDKLFSIQIGSCARTNISDDEHKWILNNILCPVFNIQVSHKTESLYHEIMYSHLLMEQVSVLNFLEGQHSAAINGLAGTGKTYVAMEWARRCVERGERVLYLCFNSALKEFLEEQFNSGRGNGLVDFKTFAGYVWNDLGVQDASPTSQYEKASKKMTDMFGVFPYQHVIIDEGQDCALSYIENSHFVEDLKEVVLCDLGDGKRRSFYLFYDQHQIVAGKGEYIKGLPKVIIDSDAKLTLYKNCRNTRSIASTSTRGILTGRQRLIMANGVGDGSRPEFYCLHDNNSAVQKVVDIASACRTAFSSRQIVVLSCDSHGCDNTGLPYNSSIKDKLSVRTENGKSRVYFNGVYEFSTYRKFKGLDRSVVILVDVGVDSFIGEQSCMPFYEASSRAKQKLFVVSSLTEDNCKHILEEFEQSGRIKRDPECEKAYASELIDDHLGGILRG